MRIKKFFALFFILMIVFVSQTSSAEMLFEKDEKHIYRNEYYSYATTVFANVKVEASEESDAKQKKSIFNSKVTLMEDEYVYAGGHTVGIAMYTDGIYVTDTVPVEDEYSNYVTPAVDAGIKKGDYIIKANGTEIDDISNLEAVLNASNGNKIKITVLRNGRIFDTDIQPIKNSKDGVYRLGLWMRDSAAGLGTITYIDPDTKEFAALGHSVCDADTGEMLMISKGRVVECNVTGVKKGTNGKAGELKGSFGTNARLLGDINSNTKFGIRGVMYDVPECELVQIGSKEFIHEGEAYIYSDFDNCEMKKYEIQILHINDQTVPSEKGLVIKIKDKSLIEKTGGIVQGLSGCPIIQDGKLIGAVTHVMINDPTKGYGIFIENMMGETA